METEKKIFNNNGSLLVPLPQLYAEWLNVNAGDEIIIRDLEGNKGRYIAVWKKQ